MIHPSSGLDTGKTPLLTDNEREQLSLTEESTDVENLVSADTNPGLQKAVVPSGFFDQPFFRSKWFRNFKITMYFFLWYMFNITYNIYNKHVLNVIESDLYITAAVLQLVVGVVYIGILWGLGLRTRPKLSRQDLITLFPIAVFHLLGHITGVISFAGALAFAHIVKSAEPVFTSFLSAAILRQFFKWQVYITLVPIVVGVAIASAHELNFTWTTLIMALTSNVLTSLRAIYSKAKMKKPVGENMSAANLFGVLSVYSMVLGIPVALLAEGYKYKAAYVASFPSRHDELKCWLNVFISGLGFYLYNEVAFLALNEVHPITHAVGNTVKRVVIIATSIIVFDSHLTLLGSIGCTIAVLGTMIYSLAKHHYNP